MKILYAFLISFYLIMVPTSVNSAITNYNHFPTLKPSHLLDDKLTDISFAFGMRVLVSDYNGPLIKLRRASDNTLKDFGWADNDIVDVAAIDAWRNGSNVFVHTWYDQSGLGRDAVQTTPNRQPRFYLDVSKPYFKGDGLDDHLTVDTPNGLQDVTNNGKEGSVLAVIKAVSVAQIEFGVLTNVCRWQAHINWNNGRSYFDPGNTALPRSFDNTNNVNKWAHYTFVRGSTKFIMRANAIDKLNVNKNQNGCNLTRDFAIGWGTGTYPQYHSHTSFLEFILYKQNISTTTYQKIEENSMTFWGI